MLFATPKFHRFNQSKKTPIQGFALTNIHFCCSMGHAKPRKPSMVLEILKVVWFDRGM
jgi:hypothetical protein